MIKKILASMLLLATPLLAHASEGINFGSLDDLNAKCRLNKCKVKKAHKSSKSSCSSFDNCDCCCEDECALPQAAYFYTVNDQNVLDGESVLWQEYEFTIKSSFIFVNPDPLSNSEIIVHEPGVYLITYSVSAENEGVDSVSLDTVTFELRLNKAAIAGTKYRVFTQPGEAPGIIDVQQINGQVLTYIPGDARIELTNVSGVEVELTANRDAFPPLTNDNSVVASIHFQKIADEIR